MRSLVLVRKLVVALVVAAQAGSFALAASLPAFAGPCDVHAAPAQAQAGGEHAHHASNGDGSGHAHAHDLAAAEIPHSSSETAPSNPAVFACCLGQAVASPGMPEPSRLVAAGTLGAPLDAALAPGDLMRADPPPRDLL